mmetsp:Transcript_116774/g.227077  ORF Transcript_116774/g.227077 Transcript_116774/m.227077 type:complete len:404 (-) Transcript_116774:242-1453(-)
MPTGGQLPVLILTGYLGAGKTTLLNYVLQEQRDKKLAVIENEIGEVSIDDALVEQKAEDMAEELIVLNNGCVCCTIRGDLLKTLQDLSTKVKDGLKLDGVLVELTGAADPAPVVQTFMLDENVVRAFYIDNVITLVDAVHAIEKLDESKGDEEKGTACAQIAFSSTVLLNKVDLVDEATISGVEKRIKQLNRVVDILRCEQARVPMHKLFGIRAFDLTRVLEEQYMDEEEFTAFYKPKMDNTISNVGVRFEGAIDMHQFQEFLNSLVGDEESAKDFFRIKGVLNIVAQNEMFVVQGVHMLKNQSFTKPWKKGAVRENRIIFIGRGMQQRRKSLTEGVMACIAKPLRFNVGDKVLAKTGMAADAFEAGTVIKHWDDFNPYRIRLQNGEEVWGPKDEDAFVKRRV